MGSLGRARCGRSLLDGGRVPGAVGACSLWKVPARWWSRSGGRWGGLAVEGPYSMVVAFWGSLGRARCGRSLLDGGRVPGVGGSWFSNNPLAWGDDFSSSSYAWGIASVAVLRCGGLASVAVLRRGGLASVAMLRRGGWLQ